MCVWQAVLAKDIFPESGVKRATVMSVVENFESLEHIRYSERRFNEVFKDSKVRLRACISVSVYYTHQLLWP